MRNPVSPLWSTARAPFPLQEAPGGGKGHGLSGVGEGAGEGPSVSGWAQGQMERPDMWLPGEAGSGVGAQAGRWKAQGLEKKRGRQEGGGGAGPPVILMPAGGGGRSEQRQQASWERKLVAFGKQLLALGMPEMFKGASGFLLFF